jgi:hypothetical protein
VSPELRLISPNFSWPVYGSYSVGSSFCLTLCRRAREIRVVVPDRLAAGRTQCFPGRESHLLRDYAACRDEPELLDFIRRFGLLGFQQLPPSHYLAIDGEILKGDPIIWALGHARIVAGVLQIIEIVDQLRDDEALLRNSPNLVADSLTRVFRNLGMQGPKPAEAEGLEDPDAVTFDFLFPEALGDEDVRWTSPVMNFEYDPIGAGYCLAANLINRMTLGIHPELSVPPPYPPMKPATKLGSELVFNSLIEVIYWQLHSRLAGGLTRCKECGRMFPSDRKRLFCSDQCKNKNKTERYRAGPKYRALKRKRARTRQKLGSGRRRAGNGHKRRHSRGH